MSLVQVRAAAVCAGGPETQALGLLCGAGGRSDFFEVHARRLVCIEARRLLGSRCEAACRLLRCGRNLGRALKGVGRAMPDCLDTARYCVPLCIRITVIIAFHSLHLHAVGH